MDFLENRLKIDGLLLFDLVEASLELRPSGLTGPFFLRFGSELNRSGGRSCKMYYFKMLIFGNNKR